MRAHSLLAEDNGMRISVVIPSFNSGRWVLDALASVFAQTRAADQYKRE